MRIRITTFLIVICVGLAGIILLYQILNLPSDIPVKNDKKNPELTRLEERLKDLEADIGANYMIVNEIKSLIKGITTTLDSSNVKVAGSKILSSKFDRYNEVQDHKMSMIRTFNLSKASIKQEDCSFSQSSPSAVDVQMGKVLESLPFNNPDGGVWKQGWNIEYDPLQWTPDNKLKVFVVPHSHNDPGWLKTFEKYFEDQTNHILDNMVVKLDEDSKRKFIWAEISYFSLWWDRKSQEVKDTVIKLVKNGQLEIVSGGWVMPDEANTHYYAMLDQLFSGHEWIQVNIGIKPNNGWAIDPFGLSPTMAYLLKKSGLKNMLIQRSHYAIKKYLAKEKSLEFRWRQIWDQGSSTDMFCHMMPFYSYDIPHTCGPNPKVCCQFDFKRLPGSKVTCPWKIAPQRITDVNVDSRARLLLDQYRMKAQLYKTNVLLVPLGDDFRYNVGTEWDDQYQNYQRLFDHMNTVQELHVQAQFGTLGDYFEALREEVGGNGDPELLFPSLSGDFFSYSDRDDHYWTGYYVTRPFYKRMDRIFHSYLRSAEILFCLMVDKFSQESWNERAQGIVADLLERLKYARHYHGLFQHHDGITGTAKNNVVIDYANKMLAGIRMSQYVMQQATHSLLSRGKSDATQKEEYFVLQEHFPTYNSIGNDVILELASSNAPTVFYIWNSEAQKRTQLLTVRVDTPFVQVSDKTGIPFLCQVDPVFNHDGDLIKKEFEVHFVVSLDALSLSSYRLQALPSNEINRKFTTFGGVRYGRQVVQNLPDVFEQSIKKDTDPIELTAGRLSATFSSSGLLQRIVSNGQTSDVQLKFIQYDAGIGGAYLFLPVGTATELRMRVNRLVIIGGPLRSSLTLHDEILKHQVVLRNSPGVDGLGLQIYNYFDIKDEKNVEFGMRFSTDIKNGDVFYTDLNGFQITKRVRYDKIPLQGNFYPMPTQLFIEDRGKRLSLLGAQPLGCSSLASGEMEILFDRQLLHDDERGLGQGIYDNVFTRHAFTLLLEEKLHTQKPIDSEGFPYALASLTSQASLSLLLHPSSILLPNKVDQSSLSLDWKAGGEFPCDVELVNLRSVIELPPSNVVSLRDSSVALTVHRSGFSCSFNSHGLDCATNGGKVRVSDLFPNSFKNSIKRMSLSHLHEGETASKVSTLSLQPMELYSYKLQFRNAK